MADITTENKVVVNIFGDEYPITGVGDTEYISRIADFVDSRMKTVAKSSRSHAKDKVAILTAMSIASELFEARDNQSEMDDNNSQRVIQLIARLDEVLVGENSD